MANSKLTCRFCRQPLSHIFADLGSSPLSNAYLKSSHLNRPEPIFPLKVYVCANCFLVQLPAHKSPRQIFSDYAYFSSYSTSWLNHAQAYVDQVISRFNLNSNSQVIEIGSNDGYLLQYFVKANIPVLGVDPAANVASVAQAAGVPTLVAFFNSRLANQLVDQGQLADLIIGNNVLAQVPQLNDFVAGLKLILKPQGVITVEFPHLLKLIQHNQFDTIYHEHFSYFSLLTVEKIFASQGLTIFDVDQLTTHGGSLRLYLKHAQNRHFKISPQVAALKNQEIKFGLGQLDIYLSFQPHIDTIKRQLMNFLRQANQSGQTVVGYGAAAKGNTLLNYCQINSQLIEYVVDRNPYKQGKFLPGSHLPIYPPEKIAITQPDYVLILPWNLKDEIISQMSYIRDWGGQFITAIPQIKIYP